MLFRPAARVHKSAQRGSRVLAGACSNVHQREANGEEQDGHRPAVDWSQYPEEASAIIVHHDSILRNKRALWTYM